MVYPAQKRYDAKNLVRVSVAFNRKTEKEITERIEQEEKKEEKKDALAITTTEGRPIQRDRRVAESD